MVLVLSDDSGLLLVVADAQAVVPAFSALYPGDGHEGSIARSSTPWENPYCSRLIGTTGREQVFPRQLYA